MMMTVATIKLKQTAQPALHLRPATVIFAGLGFFEGNKL